jgi:hypothetical protein
LGFAQTKREKRFSLMLWVTSHNGQQMIFAKEAKKKNPALATSKKPKE